MDESQAFFWLAVMAGCGWAPLLLLLWSLHPTKRGPSPAQELARDLRNGLSKTIEMWPTMRSGQKRFLVAASFSGGAATIGLSRLGVEAGDWASVVFGGMSAVDAKTTPPLGSWWTVWALQAVATAAFFAWLQLRRPRH